MTEEKFKKAKKILENLFSQKRSGTKPKMLIPEILPKNEIREPEYAVLPQSELGMLENVTFNDQSILFMAINMGKKLASNSKNRSRFFSEFKRDINRWLKMNKNLTDKDFTQKSQKFKLLINTIAKDSENYKKTIAEDEKNEKIIIDKRGVKYAELSRIYKGILEKFKNLNEEQISFLNDYRVAYTPDKVKQYLNFLKSLSKNDLTFLQSIFEQSNTTTLQTAIDVYQTLSTLSAAELECAASLCYQSTKKYYYYKKDCKIYFDNPMHLIWHYYREANSVKSYYSFNNKTKFNFNTDKIKYMQLMYAAAGRTK